MNKVVLLFCKCLHELIVYIVAIGTELSRGKLERRPLPRERNIPLLTGVTVFCGRPLPLAFHVSSFL